MDFGAHLPLMDFGGHPYTLDHLVAYTKTAAQLGFGALSVNDHMVFSVPWLDGPVALAAVMEHSGEMTLATTVALAVVRGPVPRRQDVGRDRSSLGRSAASWPSVRARRPTTTRPSVSTSRNAGNGSTRRSARSGRCGATTVRRSSAASIRPRVVSLEPRPAQPGGPPIWVGSWGSEAGLRRVARLADGWLASAYNTTPELFGDAWQALALEAGRSRQGSRHVPERARDDVVLHHRRPRRSRPHPHENGSFPPCTDPRRCSASVSRSARRNCSPRS